MAFLFSFAIKRIGYYTHSRLDEFYKGLINVFGYTLTMDFENIFNGLWAAGCFLFGVWWGTRKERKRVENPNTHIDCLKALAIVRLNYDKKDGMYSRWIYESLTYAIERIAKIDHVNTYMGKERIPPEKKES